MATYYSLSISKGRGMNIKHLLRLSKSIPNVDYSRSHLNEVLVMPRPAETVINELFAEDFKKYKSTKAGKRSPHKTPYEVIKAENTSRKGSKNKGGNKEYVDFVVQIGNMSNHPDRELASQIYKEYLEEFQEKYPHLIITGAVIHNDEATPHMHVQALPVYEKTNEKFRNLARGVNLNAALQLSLNREVKRGAAFRSLFRDWKKDANKLMEEILERHGIYRDEIGDNSKHISSPWAYKEKVRTQEVKKVEKQVNLLKDQRDKLLNQLENEFEKDMLTDFKEVKDQVDQLIKDNAIDQVKELKQTSIISDSELQQMNNIIQNATRKKEKRGFRRESEVVYELPEKQYLELVRLADRCIKSINHLKKLLNGVTERLRGFSMKLQLRLTQISKKIGRFVTGKILRKPEKDLTKGRPREEKEPER